MFSYRTGGLSTGGSARNLCKRCSNKVAKLRKFILSPAGRNLSDRVIVATNQSFAAAFSSLPIKRLPTAFHNTTLVVDEAHHIQASDVGSNKLGAAVSYLLDLNDPTIRIWLSTAYFFRGDRLPIIHDNHLAQFMRHHIPFDEYWRQLCHIKTYAYDFIAYKGTIWKELEILLKSCQQPTIIFCPPEGHKLHLGKAKRTLVGQIISLVKKYYPGATLWKPGYGRARKNVILNLVDQRDRTKKVQYAMRHGDSIAVILTVGMFREGADWVRAARVIDLIPSGSDQDRNQRFGRLIRDCPGKQHVAYYSFFPHITDKTPESQRKQLTTLFAHFHASLVLENALNPLRIPVQQPGNGNNATTSHSKVDLLGQFDSPKQEAIMRDCSEGLIRLVAAKADVGEGVSPGEARLVIEQVLTEQHGVTENQGLLAKQIVLLLRRRQDLTLSTDELVEAGFDKVWSDDALDGIIMYSGGFGGPTTFQDIRSAINHVFEQRWGEMFEKVKSLACPPSSQSSAYWWCSHNKVMYKAGTLSEDKVQLLEALPWWSWATSFKDRWEEMREIVAKLDTCPKSGTKEYTWVRTQRRLHHAGKLPQEKIGNCESIPWWSWASNQDNWEAGYSAIKGMPEPPEVSTKEYDWAKHQRRMHAKGKLSEARIDKLETLPWWTWESTADKQWEVCLSRVLALSQPPSSTSKDYYWVRGQQKRYKAGKLTTGQIACCEEIKWWTWE